MRRRYGIAVSAMMLALQLGIAEAAEPSLEQLEQISALLDSNDVEALRAYLLLRPALLEGEGTMPRLLREYLEMSRDLPAFLAAPIPPGSDDDDLNIALRRALGAAGIDGEGPVAGPEAPSEGATPDEGESALPGEAAGEEPGGDGDGDPDGSIY
jgi:hypothetical protein